MSQSQPTDTAYTDIHRAFLQLFVQRQWLSVEQGRQLLAKIIAAKDRSDTSTVESTTQEEFTQYVHAINDKISPYDLEIRSTRHQRTNVEAYVLVNTTSDALMQMATTHSADEIAFVRRMLDAMFDTYNTARAEIMAVTGMQALKLAKPTAEEAERRDSGFGAPAAAITGVQAETMLGDMVAEGWFEKSRVDGTTMYSLTPRALLELREWLVDTYNVDVEDEDDAEEVLSSTKIKACAACKGIVTIGQRCARQTCLGRLHEHCSERMFRAQGNREVCPVCQTPWDGHLLVGPKAVSATRRTNGTAVRNGRPAADGDDDDDDE